MKTATTAIFIVLLTSTAILSTGCATTKVKPEAVVVVQPAKRQPPAGAMVPCPALGELDDETFGAVVRKLGSASEAYKLCEQKRRELQEFIEAELPPSSGKK